MRAVIGSYYGVGIGQGAKCFKILFGLIGSAVGYKIIKQIAVRQS